MSDKKFSWAMFWACLFVLIVMIPISVFLIILACQYCGSLNNEITEKKFTYVGTPNNGHYIYIIVSDDFGNEKEITFGTMFSNKRNELYDEIKKGDELYISFDEPDENSLVALRTKNKVYYDIKLYRTETILAMVVCGLMGLIMLFAEIAFLIGSKKAFKKERITKRTDRPVTEDMFKDSFWVDWN